jgi:hypothetical protein
MQAEKTITVGKVTRLIAKKEGSRCKDNKTPIKRERAEKHYSCYSKTRHNFCTYKVVIMDLDSSDASK